MDQLREDARLTDCGVALNQLVKVSYWSAVFSCVLVDGTACMFNSCQLPVYILRYVVIPLLRMSFSVGVVCGQPDAPSNGAVDTSDGTSFGDVAKYSCGVGYTLNGPTERRCQADGKWSGSVPTCESELLKCNVQLCSCGCDCLHVQFIAYVHP